MKNILSIMQNFSILLFLVWGVLLLAIERFSKLRPNSRKFRYRFAVNAVMTGLVFLASFLVVSPIARQTQNFTENYDLGLLYSLNLPYRIHWIAGFLLLDMTFYWWHRANHEIPLLWRFHNVHHCDPDLDVTTSFRFHFGEILLSSGFRIVQLIIIGATPSSFIIFQTVFTMSTMFHHSNVKIPIMAERLFNFFLVTPRMHGIHHSTIRAETDSNYSVIVRWWDNIFGTIRLNVPQNSITIGVPGYLEKKDNSLKQLMIIPFTNQKEYWPDKKHREFKTTSKNHLAQ